MDFSKDAGCTGQGKGLKQKHGGKRTTVHWTNNGEWQESQDDRFKCF
jgi:hypothetical protein